MDFNENMEQALQRMEAGEDPDKIEAEMGDTMNDEDPFILPGKKGKAARTAGRARGAPRRDKTLHEM